MENLSVENFSGTLNPQSRRYFVLILPVLLLVFNYIVS
jgi:hypothetical protein